MKKGIIIAISAFVFLNIVAVVIVYCYILNHTPEKCLENAMAEAQSHMELGEYNEAIESYDAALEIDEERTDAYYGKLKAYLELNEKESLREYYEEVLEIIREYDEDIKERDINSIVSIYCMAEKVYPGQNGKIINILEEGYNATNQNATIAVYYDANTVTLEELLALNEDFCDYIKRMSQEMMLEADGLHTGALWEQYEEGYTLDYLFVINAQMITKQEYQRMVDQGIISDDFDTIINNYSLMLHEIGKLNLIYTIYEDEIGESLDLNYLIDCERYFQADMASAICPQYSEDLIPYYTELLNQYNSKGLIEYVGLDGNATYAEITVRHAYHFATLILVYNVTWLSNEKIESSLQNYYYELDELENYLTNKYN